MGTRYTIALNNYLQSQNRVDAVSWVESLDGPPQAVIWTMGCKVGQELKGTASAAQKAVAKELAAKEALIALGVPLPEDA